MNTKTIETYLVLAKKKGLYGAVRVVRTSVKKPSLKKGEVAVKIKLNAPANLFDQLIPEVEIDLPDLPNRLIKIDAEWNF